MDVLNKEEIDELVNSSKLIPKYNETIDRESAYEMLSEKLSEAKKELEKKVERKRQTKTTAPKRKTKRTKSTFEQVLSSPTAKQVGRTFVRELTRGILGVLGLGGTTKRKRRKSFF
jgi:DNA relaxase NicK